MDFVRRSTQSTDAVPTMAGMARRNRPGVPVARFIPAGAPDVSTVEDATWQASVVPMMSMPSPGWTTPAPRAHAGRSNGPEVTGVPTGRPVAAAPAACSSPTGSGVRTGASRSARWVRPVALSTASL